MDSQSRVIGQMGSTTEFFKLDSNRRISWSLIQHAKCISYQKYTQSYFFDDLRVPVPYDHYSADSGHALTRMMTELSEVVKRKEVLAANKALDKRVEEIENQIIRLWKPRAVPVTKLQGWSLRISQAIGQFGSTTEFFCLSNNVMISWSTIAHAKYITREGGLRESVFHFDDMAISASADNYSGTLKRMMAELAERNNLLAASQSLENRVKKIEKQMLCLWNAPGAPGYATARLEFEQLQRMNDQKAGESS
ncbi:hypothetical protein HDU90_007981 [Geranomyces variabilis]|nr:hypothetical protein HDU90_007981 [Geranomyces variabilis]